MTAGSFITRSMYSFSGLPLLSFGISERSMPAQNVSPVPVRIAVRSSSSLSSRFQASNSRHMTSELTAFFFSGRLSVTVRTCPSFSTRTADMGSPWLGSGRPGKGAKA